MARLYLDSFKLFEKNFKCHCDCFDKTNKVLEPSYKKANFKVHRSICRHQRQIQDNTTIHNFGRSAINVAKYKKSVTTLVYVVLAFSLCFFPYVISVVIYFGFGNRTSETYSAYKVTVVFVFMSSAINPVLYLWRMNDIRNGVTELFCWV